MSHFAQIDENNIVLQVLVVSDEQEHRGQEFLADDLGLGGRWIQTSYNNSIRRNYAGIGYTYNEELDIFVAPKPFESWLLNSNGYWEAPIEVPMDGKQYVWNETEQIWKEYKMII